MVIDTFSHLYFSYSIYFQYSNILFFFLFCSLFSGLFVRYTDLCLPFLILKLFQAAS